MCYCLTKSRSERTEGRRVDEYLIGYSRVLIALISFMKHGTESENPIEIVVSGRGGTADLPETLARERCQDEFFVSLGGLPRGRRVISKSTKSS